MKKEKHDVKDADNKSHEGGEKGCWCGDGCPAEDVCCGPKDIYEELTKRDSFPKPENEKYEHAIENISRMFHLVDRNHLSSPQPPQDWEKRFDKKFGYIEVGGGPEKDNLTSADIKSFIRELLEKTREEAIEEYKKFKAIAVKDCEQEVYRNVQGAKKEAHKALLAELREKVGEMKQMPKLNGGNSALEQMANAAIVGVSENYNQALTHVLDLLESVRGNGITGTP